MMKTLLSIVTVFCITALMTHSVAAKEASVVKSTYEAKRVSSPITIDGISNEKDWSRAKWKPMQFLSDGTQPAPEDFSGRIKVLWDEGHIYVLAEIVDDVLADNYADPLDHYWADDCLEIFVDEDNSGGPHRYSYNAFAYHIALDNQVVDTGKNKKAQLYNHHLESRWKRSKSVTTWEVALKVFDDKIEDGDMNAVPVKLKVGKHLGFMVFYCDGDGKGVREHFMGTEEIAPVKGDRNRGWLDADVFGDLVLIN